METRIDRNRAYSIRLIREGGGIAAKALEAIDISPQTIEAGIEELVGKGKEDVGPIVHYTPRAKKSH